MRIIMNGTVYMFTCKCCGCEFVEGELALKVTKYDEKPSMKCPCCGGYVRAVDRYQATEKMHENDHQ